MRGARYEFCYSDTSHCATLKCKQGAAPRSAAAPSASASASAAAAAVCTSAGPWASSAAPCTCRERTELRLQTVAVPHLASAGGSALPNASHASKPHLHLETPASDTQRGNSSTAPMLQKENRHGLGGWQMQAHTDRTSEMERNGRVGLRL